MRRRLDRLRSSGVILDRDGQLFVTSAGLRFLARFFRLLKVAILDGIRNLSSLEILCRLSSIGSFQDANIHRTSI